MKHSFNLYIVTSLIKANPYRSENGQMLRYLITEGLRQLSLQLYISP
jgi:hypothetical protein